MSPFTVQSIVRGLSLGPFAVVGASIDYHTQEINPCLLQSQFYESVQYQRVFNTQ